MKNYFNSNNLSLITAWSLILVLVFVGLNPPLTNIFMFVSVVMVVGFKENRIRFMQVLKQPLGFLTLLWLFCVAFFAVFTQGDQQTAYAELWGWRKLLLLPIAASVFSGRVELQKLALKWFVIACVLVAAYSFISLLFPVLHFSDKYPPGIVMRNHVTQAMLVGVASTVVFAWGIANYNGLNGRQRFWSAILFLFLLMNVFIATGGRSGYIAVFIMLNVCWFFYSKGLIWWKRGIGVMVLIPLIVLGVSLSPTAKSRLELANQEAQHGWQEAQNTSVGLRLTFFKRTMDMLPDYWLRGAGSGGFSEAYQKEIKNVQGAGSIVTGDPHNQYLKILIEQSIFGLFIFLALLIGLLRSPATQPMFRFLATATLLAWCVSSLANSHFATFNEGVFVWLWLGILLAPPHLVKNEI